MDGWPIKENPDPLSAIPAGKPSSSRKRKLPLQRSMLLSAKLRRMSAANVLLSLQVLCYVIHLSARYTVSYQFEKQNLKILLFFFTKMKR